MMTISAALAQIKILKDRCTLAVKEATKYVARPETLKDPLETSGGSTVFVASKLQSAADMRERIIRIRTKIQESNIQQKVTVGGVTRTVAEWLTWKRDISTDEFGEISELRRGIDGARARRTTTGVDATNATVSLDEKVLAERNDRLVTIFGELDGALSQHNATTTIDV